MILHCCNLDDQTKKVIYNRVTENGESEQKAELLQQPETSPSNENESEVSKIDRSKLDY